MLHQYFDELKHATNMPGSLFSPEKIMEQSKLFASHPAVRELHAYVLDDENTSNHHCLITAEPLAGSVFFLSHDGDSRVVFETTTDFLSAARRPAPRVVSRRFSSASEPCPQGPSSVNRFSKRASPSWRLSRPGR